MQNIIEIRSKIHQHGRINIPANLRNQLHFKIGDDIIFQVQGDNLLITTPDRALSKFQQLLKQHQITQKNQAKLSDLNDASNIDTNEISMVDELIAMRREEAEHE